jgi:diguanylate cyclase (GGDEF)-like protein
MSKIAIIDDSATIVKILSDLLTGDGYTVFGMNDTTDALERAVRFAPDLIILDVVMPDICGYDLCRIFRNDTRTAHLPIILLTSKSDLDDKVTGLEAGADDYIVKPFQAAEVLARLKTHLRRANQQKSFSPLTGLPGNVIIEEEIKKCLSRSDLPFAILYLDLDNFKSFNDTYGFVKGDELLRSTSNILRQTIQDISPLHSFVGHIGGDDFIIVVPAEQMETACNSIIEQINATMPSFYNEEDRKRGYVTSHDRRGIMQQFPLVTISIAAITNKNNTLTELNQIGELAAALKKRAKDTLGSVFVTNE